MPIIKLEAVVTKHIPRYCVAMGVHARVIKEHGRDIQKLCLDV
jgi:acetyltransferase-like isoleucine patch superfamily enzyme